MTWSPVIPVVNPAVSNTPDFVGVPRDTGPEQSTLISHPAGALVLCHGADTYPESLRHGVGITTARRAYTLCSRGNRRLGPPEQYESGRGFSASPEPAGTPTFARHRELVSRVIS